MSYKIFHAGEWSFEMYDAALAAGFEREGAQVTPFAQKDFHGSGILSRVQIRLFAGPEIDKVNKEFLESLDRVKPDILFLNRCTEIREASVAKAKLDAPSMKIITFNHDNPFEDGRLLYWRHYLAALPYAHINYFVRPSNIVEAQRRALPSPRLLLQYYVKGLHQPLAGNLNPKCHELVFVGHYEPDGRRELLEALLTQNIPLRINGNRWGEVPPASSLHAIVGPLIFGPEYSRVLATAKIALALLSTRNRDVYTYRCFEIPACGTFMLAQRTPELQQLFREGVEADYFSNVGELCQKAAYYLSHPVEREQIARRGHLRCLASGHSNLDRARQVLTQVAEIGALAQIDSSVTK